MPGVVVVYIAVGDDPLFEKSLYRRDPLLEIGFAVENGFAPDGGDGFNGFAVASGP